MAEFGIYSDEGFVETQFWSESEAEERRKELLSDPEGYDSEDIWVVEMCYEHDEQPADSCTECEPDD
jgi:hypothetical protein